MAALALGTGVVGGPAQIGGWRGGSRARQGWLGYPQGGGRHARVRIAGSGSCGARPPCRNRRRARRPWSLPRWIRRSRPDQGRVARRRRGGWPSPGPLGSPVQGCRRAGRRRYGAVVPARGGPEGPGVSGGRCGGGRRIRRYGGEDVANEPGLRAGWHLRPAGGRRTIRREKPPGAVR